MRWRSLVAGFSVLVWMILYCLICMELLVLTIGAPVWLMVPVYLIAGILWVFPCYYLFKWAAKDPRSSLSNEDAERRFD